MSIALAGSNHTVTLVTQECLEVLGIPTIIAFLTKPDLDAESKSLSASLLISIGNAGPVYRSFAKSHGIFEALCNWAQSTDNERHHSKIQVPAPPPPPPPPTPCLMHAAPPPIRRTACNCLRVNSRRPRLKLRVKETRSFRCCM